MDLWASPVLANHIDTRTDDPAAVRAELDKHDIKAICMSVYYTTHSEKVDLFRFAAAVGIPYITFTGAPLANYFEKMTGMEVKGRTLTPPGAGWKTFIDTLTGLLDAAADAGVRIALQVPHVYTEIETTEQLKRLRHDVDHPALYFAVSPTHAVARGSKLPELFEVCGDRLAIVHIWNVKLTYLAARDDRAWGTPAEQLAIKGYYDFVPLIQSMQGPDMPYLLLKAHGTESWTDADQIKRIVRDATAVLKS